HQRPGPDRQPRPLLAAAPPQELALAAGLARPLRRRRRPATRRGLTASPCTDETEPTVERPGRPADHPRPSSRPTRNPFSPHRSKRFRKRPGASRLSRRWEVGARWELSCRWEVGCRGFAGVGPILRAMRYAVSIPPFTDAATVIALGREAEEAGWDGVFLWDHVQWLHGMPVHDPWVLLGAIAQATERVRLGTLVTPPTRRRPHTLAKQVTSLDHLSGGRAVLGVGLGEPDDLDFADLGDESDKKLRGVMLDEALDVIDQLWSGPTDHVGEHYRVKADFVPRPAQQPRPPVWVGGGERSEE